MAGVEADEEINPVAMEVGKVEEEMDEELDTDMVVFRVGELGGQCGNCRILWRSSSSATSMMR